MLALAARELPIGDDWTYEVKWDGYRAQAVKRGATIALASRNLKNITRQFPDVVEAVRGVHADSALLDGEIVALDDQGRPSFSLMQQRAGIRSGIKRSRPKNEIPVLYYAFDLLYLDGYDLMKVNLEQRKEILRTILTDTGLIRYSEHFLGEGEKLYEAAKQQGLEGIVAKRRDGCYIQKRSREWLKMKITRRQECVIGGYTDPRGSREHFGSLILGLYDEKRRLLHVGHAGTGFNEATHEDMWQRLQNLQADKSPFYRRVEATRKPHWVRPELVAEIKFTEWTHEGQSGSVKMRAPVFEGLRFDKPPRECVFETPIPAEEAA